MALNSVNGTTFKKRADRNTPIVKKREHVMQIVKIDANFTFIEFELNADRVQKESKETAKISIISFGTFFTSKYVFNLYYDFYEI